MKKIISLLLIITLIFCFTGCGAQHSEKENKKVNTESKAGMLDGKKIIFIGNSYTYYGMTVLEKKQSYLWQEQRLDDKGYFYELCKLNGAKVKVTNWTFGGHSISDEFITKCTADRGCTGVDHASYLKDLNYDYVILQSNGGDNGDFMNVIKTVSDKFRLANPDVKIFFYNNSSNVINNNENTLKSLQKLPDELGITVVDWGSLVYDIINGKVAVPNAKCSYNKNSFIISKSERDGFHPNQLTGYITTLMLYSAITGESAVGQPYDFCNNPDINKKFDFKTFIFNNYIGDTTNYPEIFESKSDMKGIQTLIDKYLKEKVYTKYATMY